MFAATEILSVYNDTTELEASKLGRNETMQILYVSVTNIDIVLFPPPPVIRTCKLSVFLVDLIFL